MAYHYVVAGPHPRHIICL